MKKICLIKNWDFPDLKRQSPGGFGRWEDVQVCDYVENETYDYLVVFNAPHHDIKIKLPEGRRILYTQESPIPLYQWHTRSFADFDTAVTFWKEADVLYPGAKIMSAQTCLPWHIGKSYDELIAITPGALLKKKQNKISWITSNDKHKPGQVKRLRFLDFIHTNGLTFDLRGKGFDPIDDKYDALEGYKYSIAIENYSCPDYWTEKISDCFLSYTMPFYHGATNIDGYFPKGSFVAIDPDRPEESLSKIKEAVEGNLWSKNFDAICEAREFVLKKYQVFPVLNSLVRADEGKPDYKEVVIPANVNGEPVRRKLGSRASQKKLTVAICTRNRSEILRLCVESMLKQDADSTLYDILIVDNNSTDQTQQVAEQFAKEHPHISYLRENEIGLSNARNRSITHARTEYIAFLDDDGLAAENFVTRILYVIDEFCYDCFGGTYTAWYLKKLPRWLPENYGVLTPEGTVVKTLHDGYIQGGISCWNRTAVMACGMFPVGLGMTGNKVAYGEETYLLNQFRKRGLSIGYDPLWTMEHLVAPYKYKVSWHLKFYYAHGRDSVGIWEKKPIISRKIILKAFFTKHLWKLPGLMWKTVSKRNYRWQNMVIEFLKPTLHMYGQYKGLVALNKNSNRS